jgi:hypothetical protein
MIHIASRYIGHPLETTGTTTSTRITAEHRKASPPINLERNDADSVVPLAVARRR